MMNIKTPNFNKIIPFIFIVIFHFSLNSQQINADKKVDESFEEYTNSYQEVVYVHLNKNKLILGESLGFTAYVTNKRTKTLAKETTNLYAIITDINNNVINKQLVKVENGIANGSFALDSNFKNGTYTFKAYTNWMLNFAEHNYFEETFDVISSEEIDGLIKTEKDFFLDVQILPESGHLLNNVANTLGVIAKDSLGYGVANLEGEVFDDSNNFITSFSLNKLGIGRFSFVPNMDKNYKVLLNNRGKKTQINFKEKIKLSGIILRVSENSNHVIVAAVTNKNTLKSIKNKTYKLVFHDGKNMKTTEFNFGDKNIVTKKIAFTNLSKGINVFTLFNENNKPIAERMFFNHHEVKIIKNTEVSKTIVRDSLHLNLRFEESDKEVFNNLSISVLPKETKSYAKNTNIVAQTLIQPYVNGFIEDGGYYFTNINKQTKYDLDNLLITQGWSSYNWSQIFNHTKNLTYEFEKGISIKVNVPNLEKENNFLIHHLSNRAPEIISFNKEVAAFSAEYFYPENEEDLYISKIAKKGGLKPVPLYLQFNPTHIPTINQTSKVLTIKPSYFTYENYMQANIFSKLNNRDMLDEVLIKGNSEQERKNNIRNNARGRIFFTREWDRNFTLAIFMDQRANFRAEDDFRTGNFNIKHRSLGTPEIYVDDFQIINFQMLYGYNLDIVDYVDIDTFGFIPILRIYTNPKKYRIVKKTISTFKFPITFTKADKFYVPQYEDYTSTFYKDYGVINWLPINKIDKYGNVTLQISKPQTNDFILFMEGMNENGDFYFIEKPISLK